MPVHSDVALAVAPTATETLQRVRILEFLLTLCCAVDAADKALLPATFQALQSDLHVTPSQLGTLSLCQSLAFSLALPFWGAATVRWSSRNLLVSGTMIWSVATALMAFSLSFREHCFLRVLNGIGLCGVMPISQAVLAGLVQEDQRGAAFGKMQAAMTLASMCASWFAVMYQGVGIEFYGIHFKGWQFIYGKIALLSMVLSGLILHFMPENIDDDGSGKGKLAVDMSLSSVLGSMKKILQIPSFVLLVLQGVSGGVPWNAMAFLTLYWQNVGYSSIQVGRLALLQGVGAACGSLLGGSLGDFAARRSPGRGRVYVAISSVMLGLPLFVIMLAAVPASPHYFIPASVTLLAFSLVSCWCPVAANKPICAELVSTPSERAQIVALWVMIEGICTSVFGAPLVGRLSEHFGYRLDAHGRSVGTRTAEALGKSLVGVSIVAWLLCGAVWVCMLFTFPKDRAAAREREESKLTTALQGKLVDGKTVQSKDTRQYASCSY